MRRNGEATHGKGEEVTSKGKALSGAAVEEYRADTHRKSTDLRGRGTDVSSNVRHRH